jgi:hypothetical protein
VDRDFVAELKQTRRAKRLPVAEMIVLGANIPIRASFGKRVGGEESLSRLPALKCSRLEEK